MSVPSHIAITMCLLFHFGRSFCQEINAARHPLIANFQTHRPLPLTRMNQFLLLLTTNDGRAKHPIPRIAQPRHEVAIVVQFLVYVTDGNMHIVVIFLQFRESLFGGNYRKDVDFGYSPLLCKK